MAQHPLVVGHEPQDGRALQRLIAALRVGRLPPIDRPTVGGKRHIGYLSEVVLDGLAPATTTVLRELVVRLRQAVEAFDDDRDPDWLPSNVTDVDEQTWTWGLPVGLDTGFRRSLADDAP